MQEHVCKPKKDGPPTISGDFFSSCHVCLNHENFHKSFTNIAFFHQKYFFQILKKPLELEELTEKMKYELTYGDRVPIRRLYYKGDFPGTKEMPKILKWPNSKKINAAVKKIKEKGPVEGLFYHVSAIRWTDVSDAEASFHNWFDMRLGPSIQDQSTMSTCFQTIKDCRSVEVYVVKCH